MRLTNEEALREVLKRGDAVRRRRERRGIQVLGCVTGVLAVALICVIATLSGGGTGSAGTAYGAFLLSAEAGGYVLTAVIAFAVGVVLTVVIHRYRKLNKRDKRGTEDPE